MPRKEARSYRLQEGYAGVNVNGSSSYVINGEYLYEKHRFTHYKTVEGINITGYSDTRPIFSKEARIVYYKIGVKNAGNKVVRKVLTSKYFRDKLYFYVYAIMKEPFKPLQRITTDIDLMLYEPGFSSAKDLGRKGKLYFIENSPYPTKNSLIVLSMPFNFEVHVYKSSAYTPGEFPEDAELITDSVAKGNKVEIKMSMEPKMGYFFKVCPL
ncbi:hypothetical protein HS7_14950 [Sulfolobales archaeon HS-7]|nr:hypothetical protein HS7_14950 [Sulfolobales archaeon HS-7]